MPGVQPAQAEAYWTSGSHAYISTPDFLGVCVSTCLCTTLAITSESDVPAEMTYGKPEPLVLNPQRPRPDGGAIGKANSVAWP